MSPNGKKEAKPTIYAVCEARKLADKREMQRFAVMPSLFARARVDNCDDSADNEICVAAGYSGIGEFWEVALSTTMKVSFFAHLLYIFSLGPSPTQPMSPFDRRKKTQWLIDGALRSATASRLSPAPIW